MPPATRALAAGLTLLLFFGTQTGCMTSKRYRMVKEKEQTQPAYLNLTTESTGLGATVDAVIVYHGPGSWKQNALWDEYVVRLQGRGPLPLVVESASLLDLLGVEKSPGDHPWRLEHESEAGWKRYARVTEVVLGAGAAVGAIEFAALGYGLTGGAISGVFFIMPVVVLADVSVVVVQNHRNKDKVKEEFDRRRLAFPISLLPGQTVTGSLFFPMTPAPRSLIVRGRSGSQPLEVNLELKPLAGLHLKPK